MYKLAQIVLGIPLLVVYLMGKATISALYLVVQAAFLLIYEETWAEWKAEMRRKLSEEKVYWKILLGLY